MNKNTYATPSITVTAIEAQSLMANTINGDTIVVDPNDETTIKGEDVMSKDNNLDWE